MITYTEARAQYIRPESPESEQERILVWLAAINERDKIQSVATNNKEKMTLTKLPTLMERHQQLLEAQKREKGGIKDTFYISTSDSLREQKKLLKHRQVEAAYKIKEAGNALGREAIPAGEGKEI